MAAAATLHPSPPPPARCTMARLACTPLARAAVDAVICFFLASMWVLFWGLATKEIGRLACGDDCAVVTAAYMVVSVAGVTLFLLLPFALLLALMMACAQAAAATDIEATKEPAPETLYAAMRDTLWDSLALGLLALLAFTLLTVIGDLVKGDSLVMGSRRERMGSVIHNVGALGTVMVNCSVSGPIMTVRIWRAWRNRMARHAL